MQIIKRLDNSPTGAKQTLVKHNGEYYVVSEVIAMYSGLETLIFPSNSEGEVTDYCDVGGARGEDTNVILKNWTQYFYG